jgi:hypothetical protein
MIQLSDYLCGGYFLSRPRRDYNDPPFPDSYLSISGDICDFVPDSWAIEWAHQDDTPEERAKTFNLEPETFKTLTEWSTAHIGKKFGAWNVIYQLETAQYLRTRFLSHLIDITLFGIGLHSRFYKNFIEKTAPPPTQPGFAPNGEFGIHTSIKQKRFLAPGGISLGFELVNQGRAGMRCSWLDIGLEKNAQEMKIQINEFGLIDNLEDAIKYTNLVTEGKVKLGAIITEPGPWLPWLLVDYSKV